MVPRYCRGVRARESHSSAHNRNNSAIDLQTLARARAFSPSAAGGAYTKKKHVATRRQLGFFAGRGGRMLAYAPYQRGLTDHLRAGSAFMRKKVGAWALFARVFHMCWLLVSCSFLLPPACPSLTIDIPLVTAPVPATRPPMRGVPTKPSETLSPAQKREREREREMQRIGSPLKCNIKQDVAPDSATGCCVCAVEMKHTCTMNNRQRKIRNPNRSDDDRKRYRLQRASQPAMQSCRQPG